MLLPDRTAISVSIKKNSSTVEVYETIVEKTKLSKEIATYFAIFEIVEHNFERKLQPNEFPYSLYIQNIQNTSAASTCLIVKKWLFCVQKEIELSSNDLLEQFFFYQVRIGGANKKKEFDFTSGSVLSLTGNRRCEQGPSESRKQTVRAKGTAEHC